MKHVSPSTAVLFVVFLLAFGALLVNPIPAQSSTPVNRGQTAPTPAPETAQPGTARGTSPILGIVILLAPAVFMIWKSRGQKQPDIKGACCLPVIDENKRPFQAMENEDGPNGSGQKASGR